MGQITKETYANGVLVSTTLVDIPDSVVNGNDLQSKLTAAIGVNATFLGLASPTNAQTLAQVQRLTREVTALLRLTLGALDDTSGT